MANTTEKQAHIVIYFSRCAYGASRIAGVDFLLDGDCRWKSENSLAFGFGHLAHELTCVAAQAFDIASLPFCIKGVESKR